MLGTFIDKQKEREAQVKRGFFEWSKVKKWFWNSKLSKRTIALIFQSVVEASLDRLQSGTSKKG